MRRFLQGVFVYVAIGCLLLTSCALNQVPADPKRGEEVYRNAALAKTAAEQGLLAAYQEYQAEVLGFKQFEQAKQVYQQYVIAQTLVLIGLKVQYPVLDWDALQPKPADAVLQIVLHKDFHEVVQ
jgi:hypothetical protein